MKRSKEDVLEMYEVYKSGKPLREVGEMFGGVSKQRVEQLFKMNNLPTRRHSESDLTKASYEKLKKRLKTNRVYLDAKKLQKLLDEGKTRSQICEEMNCTITNIKNTIEKFNLKKPSRITNPKLTDEVLKQLYIKENKTALQIAEEFGYSKSRITMRLSEQGVRKSSAVSG